MRVFLDTCVWGGAVRELRAAGHEAVWGGDWSQDPGDKEILAQAYAEGRILVTLDKDFGELAIDQGLRHCGIVRLVNISARRQGKTSQWVIEQYAEELLTDAMITVEPGRVRIRSASDDLGDLLPEQNT